MCELHDHQLPQFVITLVVNCGGMLMTILSLLSLAINPAMDPSLQRIFISFSIANLIGTGMLTYDSISLICSHNGEDRLGIVVTITVTLSLSHLMLLMLAEYIILTSGSRHRANDYTGLILISWIISFTLGGMNVVTITRTGRVAFAVMFFLILIYIVIKYMKILQLHNTKKQLQLRYKKHYLRCTFVKPKGMRKCWKLKFVTIIIFSFICCSVPWLINELKEGFEAHAEGEHGHEEGMHMMHSVVLVIYSLNFYFPSAICMYVKFIQWISKTKHPVFLTYRVSDIKIWD